MAHAWSPLSCEIEAGRTLSSRLSYTEKEKIEIKSFVLFQVVGKPKMHVHVYNVIFTPPLTLDLTFPLPTSAVLRKIQKIHPDVTAPRAEEPGKMEKVACLENGLKTVTR